jgi:predicted ABC-type sugar transport system permease subunit
MQRQDMRVLRWILFLPAALLARVVIGLCAGDFLTQAGSSDFAAFALLLLAYALQGVAFVLVGAITAPGRQREIAWLLAGALTVVAVIRVVQDNESEYVLSLAVILTRPAGAFLTAFMLHRSLSGARSRPSVT